MGCKIIYANLILQPGVVIAPSSEETAMPRSALLRPVPSDVLRFRTGWDFQSGVNDTVQFNRAGAKLFGVTAGQYATGALLAAELQVQFPIADATPAWTNTYSGGTKKFTTSTPAHTFDLLWGSGSLQFRNASRDLGYAHVDTGSALSQTSAVGVSQGRHWVYFDLLAAQSFGAVFVAGHNVSALGSITLAANSTDLQTQGLGAAVDFSVALVSLGVGLSGAYFASQSKRYLRLLMDDVENAAGYNELGVLFVGTTLDIASPTRDLPMGYDVEVVDEREELSDIAYAIGGAVHQVSRPTRKVWKLNLHAIDDAKKVELETFAATVKVGGCFFFDFDGLGTNVRYVFLDRGLTFQAQESVPRTWTVQMELREALG